MFRIYGTIIRTEALNSGDQIFKALQDISKTRKGEELGVKVLEKAYDELFKDI